MPLRRIFVMATRSLKIYLRISDEAFSWFRSVARALVTSILLVWSAPGATSCCCNETPEWQLGTTIFSGYGNSAMLVPGNDSRVNLLLLLMDTRPPGTFKILPQSHGVSNSAWGATSLFQWASFRDSLFDDTLGPGESSRSLGIWR
jgi:hypothetical protein